MKQFKKMLSFLLVMATVLSMVYIAPINWADAAASDYISATYAANLSVKTNKVVSLMAEPVSSATAKYTLPADTMLTVKALHKNTSGTYWYEVLYYDMTLYVDATATTMVDHLTGDVTATDLQTPAALGYGAGFPLKGTVSSSLNKLGTITAAVHRSSNLSEAPVLYSSDTPSGNSYTITGSSVDDDLWFSDLAAGSYTFLLTAEAISYYIDGNGALATSVQTVVLDNKPLIITNASSPNTVVAKGIDVSYYQGNITWSSVASQVDFAILRLGYATTLDSKFTTYAAACNTYDIPFGVYLYSYAESEAEAIEEAEFVISVLKDYDVDLPVFFDIEDDCQSSLGSTAIQNIVKAFCETIKDAGYQPGLYTFLSWYNSYFYDSYYSSLPKWVAQLSSSCTYAKGVTAWQYSWTGSFSGISGDVDCDYWYGEFPGKNTDTSFLGSCTYYPANSDATVTAEVNLRQYPSTDYTILETLSVGTQVHITGLYKAPNSSYWYQIDRDGTTGYISCDYAKVTNFRYDDLSVVDPTMANISQGAGYYLKGKLYAKYNSLGTVHAKVYAGEDTLASPAISSSDTASSKTYTLNYSTVCDDLIFSDLATGYYTYEISADVTNYYYSNGLASQTENVVVWTAPFTVGSASITPPESVTCSHNKVTVAGTPATCTQSGLTDKIYCSLCGLVFQEQTVIPTGGHGYSSVTTATCTEAGTTTYTCTYCGDSYTEAQAALGHSFHATRGFCTVCGLISSDTAYYLLGTINGVTYTKEMVIADPDSAQFAMLKFDQNGVLDITLTAPIEGMALCRYRDDGNSSRYDCSPMDGDTAAGDMTFWVSNVDSGLNLDLCVHQWDEGQIIQEGTCVTEGVIKYTCTGTTWDGHSCTRTKDVVAPTGHIAVIDEGKAATCTETGLTQGSHCEVCGEVLTEQTAIAALGHSYTDGVCEVCGAAEPMREIKPSYSTLSFEDEVFLNIYFTTNDMEDVALEDMGLITWRAPKPTGTIDDAHSIIPGALSSGTRYMVRTEGISAKNLSDTVYFKIYAKLPDGTYVYSSMFSTSPKAYAMGRINNSTDERMRAVCVAMLNYGAEAQKFFGHKPYALMNADLTAEQQALVEAYTSSMVQSPTSLSSYRTVNFVNNGGFTSAYPTVSFDSAFAINFYFAPAYEPDGDVTMYYWSADTINQISVLTVNNATSAVAMEKTESGEYWGELTGVAAKEMDTPGYFAAVYTSGGVTYTTKVIPYSLGQYCKTTAANSSSDMQDLAASTAVYGYYAKEYFAALQS